MCKTLLIALFYVYSALYGGEYHTEEFDFNNKQGMYEIFWLERSVASSSEEIYPKLKEYAQKEFECTDFRELRYRNIPSEKIVRTECKPTLTDEYVISEALKGYWPEDGDYFRICIIYYDENKFIYGSKKQFVYKLFNVYVLDSHVYNGKPSLKYIWDGYKISIPRDKK